MTTILAAALAPVRALQRGRRKESRALTRAWWCHWWCQTRQTPVDVAGRWWTLVEVEFPNGLRWNSLDGLTGDDAHEVGGSIPSTPT
jgi:hypothetical protein